MFYSPYTGRTISLEETVAVLLFQCHYSTVFGNLWFRGTQACPHQPVNVDSSLCKGTSLWIQAEYSLISLITAASTVQSYWKNVTVQARCIAASNSEPAALGEDQGSS